MIVVSDTSPITNLSAIQQIDILRQLYGELLIPQAVYDEMVDLECEVPGTQEVQALSWIQTRQANNRSLVAELQVELDAGESEAIALALELKADRLLIDDYQARVVASRFRLRFTGILGVLLVAKSQGLIIAVKPIVDDLIYQAGFRVNDRVYREIMQMANEVFE
jgi:predicted nucleic acid-binding protein